MNLTFPILLALVFLNATSRKSNLIDIYDYSLEKNEVQKANDDGKTVKREKVESAQKCNNDLLKAFNIKPEIEDSEKPVAANFEETEYCRRNGHTCCTEKEFQSIVPEFLKAYKKLHLIFEPIEELLTLFRGKKFSEEILDKIKDAEVLKKSGCSNFAESVPSRTINFDSSNELMSQYIYDLHAILSDLDFYLKRQGWFYGDLICSICNPEDQEYISLKEGKLTFTASHNTCIELFDMKELELRMAAIYIKFLRPAANTYTCVDRKENELKFEIDEQAPPLDLEKHRVEADAFKKCHAEFEYNEECMKLCHKDLSEFKIDAALMEAYTSALKLLFPALTGMSVEEYYEERKLKPFPEEALSSSKFFEMSGIVRGDDESISFQASGVHVFNNHWSKKYQEYKEPKETAKTE